MQYRFISLFGYFVLIGIAWLMSSDRKKFPWRVVLVGSALQVALGWLILRTTPGEIVFDQAKVLFDAILSYSDEGARFVFGEDFRDHFFAFKVLPTIIFVSALAAILYHLGIMQWVVQGFAIVMQKLMGLSGAESLSASANIFMGQTEAPLLVKPFIPGMTNSELFAVMVGGFANISVSLIAVYGDKARYGIEVGHLLASSVISAPASLLLAKVIVPETQIPATLGRVDIQPPRIGANVIEAAAIGTKEGLLLALNVGAMLIVFYALVAMANGLLYQMGLLVSPDNNWSLALLLGYVFMPLAWLLGVPLQDCQAAGQLLGIKLVATEFFAYEELGKMIAEERLTLRTRMLMTYALCGFSNFASIGIQIGGLGGIAPDRQADIARLGLRAMIGGMLATCMTACVAGVLRTI